MDSIEKIKHIFERFEYDLLKETNEYLVYAAGHNLYLGVEIVSFIDMGSDVINKLVTDYREANYSVRVCSYEDADSIEEYLFDWFFQVELSNKKIGVEYKEYTEAVMKAYGLEKLDTKKYEYVTSPYKVERNNETSHSLQGGSIVESLRRELDSRGIKFIIVEAPAGYGKTSTAMELLNSYVDVKHGTRPFFMSLSKDRQAPTFYYLLVSQINKTFNVRLGDDLVIHYIKSGRIPLIIDGFDELLSEDLDKGDISRASKKGITMLSTIAELLKDNAKIVLTTRKTAILSGQLFLDWYQKHFEEAEGVEFVRYKIDLPQIDSWLDHKRIAMLSDHISELSNPVLLGYLHYLNDEEYNKECKSDTLIESYITRLLTREIDRQSLPFTVEEQKLIYERLASAYAYEDLTADSRANVKDNILMMSADLLEHYATITKDSHHLANSLTNHALLDRKGENGIGFVNDFVLGIMLGNALLDSRDMGMKGYYEGMTTKFIEKLVLSMAACEESKRELVWLQMTDQCKKLTQELRFFADAKLLHKTSGDYKQAYFDGYQLTRTEIGNQESSFSKCHFLNIDFIGGSINFDQLDECTFINCVFNQTEFKGDHSGCDFYECLKEGKAYNNKEIIVEEEDSSEEDYKQDRWAEMLSHYLLKGGQGKKMQMISFLKREYGDSHEFKKTFSELCAKKFIVTNGDKSHITGAGLEYLKTNRG